MEVESNENKKSVEEKYKGIDLKIVLKGNSVKNQTKFSDIITPESIVGELLLVYWPNYAKSYVGVVKSYRKKTKKHVLYYYSDNQLVMHDLVKEKWCIYRGDENK
jgi:hypothetical protein